MTDSDEKSISTVNHNWIYSEKKKNLIDFLVEKKARKIYELLTTDELRKVIAKWYKQKEQSEIQKEYTSNQEDIAEKIKVRTDTTRKQSTSAESKEKSSQASTIEMEKEDWTFDPKKEDWDAYIERFDLYIEVKEVKSDKKTAHLLTKVGRDTYKLIRELCAPIKPKDVKYEDIVQIVKTHHNPKRNEAMERYKFQQARQAPNESIAEYLARLKELALYCNYTDLNMAIRYQLVTGVADHDTRLALFSEDNITYDKAVQLATTREAAQNNTACTERAAQSTQESSVKYISPLQRSGNRSKFNERYVKDAKTNGNKLKPSGDKRYICFCCGKINNHYSDDCRMKNSTCNACKGKGHIERMCFKKFGKKEVISRVLSDFKNYSKSKMNYVQEEEDNSTDSGESSASDFHLIFDKTLTGKEGIYNIKADPHYEYVEVLRKRVKMEVDTGAYVAAMSEVTKNKLFPEAILSRCDLMLTSYNAIQLDPIGVMKGIEVKFNNQARYLDLYIIKGEGPTLLGRQWLKAFGLWPMKLEKAIDAGVNHLQLSKDGIKGTMLKQFPELFSGKQGCYNGRKIKLYFKDNVKPVQLKPYHAPFALASKVAEEIKRLVKAGNLIPVKCSEWATPVIPVLKKNGQVRLCGNFKVTVNPQLIVKRHAIPIKEKIFKTMQVGQSWSQIDLTHAFMQFPVDEESRKVLTIITEEGLYNYTKMPEGVSSSAAECQEILEELLRGIPYTEVYIDNIYCTGRNDKEHKEILCEIFRRLEEAGLRINVNKCDFFKKEIEILGFLIDESGLKPTPSKIKAINDAPMPTNFKELKAFLGLLNFYEKFLPDRAIHVKPLYDLGNKAEWVWTEECTRAVEWLKKQITSDKVLTLYDPNKQLVLACDASYYGLSAVLSHRFTDGSERPIAFASKIIPKNELHRAILDKEAGAIVFGFRKFYQYVFGAKIILKTDHEPLKFIFGPNKNLSIMIQSRLIRWAYFLYGFTYEIEIVKSHANGNCDALSRLPIDDVTPVFEGEYSNLNYVVEGISTLDYKCVARELLKDANLKKVMQYVQQGWPKDTKGLNVTEKNLYNKKLELSVEKGCLMWGFRVVIPKSLQKVMLNELHASHMGAIKMKQLARNYFWWPNLNEDIEQTTGTCKICLEARVDTPKIALTPWLWPSEPWSRIHTDFLGPFHGCMFLVVIDAHSKWPEIVNMKNNTQADKLVKAFDKIFSRHGLPELLVSDNGRQFTSDEFGSYLKKKKIKHSFTPPYCPATNGAAENFVKTFKSNVNKIIRDGKHLDDAVNLFLFDYRSTVHCTTGRSPAWLIYKREMRTRFDLLIPKVRNEVENKQFEQKKSMNGNRKCDVSIGEKVFVKDHRSNPKLRSEAQIVKRNSPSTYTVKFKDETVAKKHANQIVKTKIGSKIEKEESVSVDNLGGERKKINKAAENGVMTRRSARLKSKEK